MLKKFSREIKLRYLIIGIVIYYVCLVSQAIWLRKDSAVYLLLGRSLAQGRGYIDYYLPRPQPHNLYPPGYPFILSLVIKIFGEDLLLLRLASTLMAGIAVVVLALLLKKYLKAKEVFWVVLLFSLNPLFINLTHGINSEAAYMLFSWLGILLVIAAEDTLMTKKILLGTLAIVACFYTRIIGISLYLSLAVYLLIKRRYRQVILVFLFGLMLLPWLIRLLSSSRGYYHTFVKKDYYGLITGTIGIFDILLRLFTNLKYYLGKVVADLLFFPYFREVTFGSPFFPVKVGLSLLYSVLFLLGFFRVIRQGIRITEIYTVLYCAVILFWPFHSERFLVPIYPFLLIYLLTGLGAPRIKYIKITLISLLALALIFVNFQVVNNLMTKNGSVRQAWLETLLWLKQNTAQEAIIMSDDPAGVYLYTQKKAVNWSLKPSPSDSLIEIKQKDVSYFMLEKEEGLVVRGRKLTVFDRCLKPLLERYPGYFKLVYSSSIKPEIVVYRIDTSYK